MLSHDISKCLPEIVQMKAMSVVSVMHCTLATTYLSLPYVHRQSVVQCSDMVLLLNSRSGRLSSDFNFDFPHISMEESLFHENTLKHSSVDLLLLYTHILYIIWAARLPCRTPLRHSVEVTEPEMGCCE